MAELDQKRERIQDDLRGLIAGDVRCDDIFSQLYSSDSSIYEIRPLGVVRPRSTRDVVACVQYAAEKQIPIHARGAGTGVAGESLGPGLVLDFSRYLRRIIHADSETVRVQAGLTQERLNWYLRTRGRLFGPDPGAGITSTIGGLLAIDGAGPHWLKYGSARHHVLGLKVVTAAGEVLDLGEPSARVPSRIATGSNAGTNSRPGADSLAEAGRPNKNELLRRRLDGQIHRLLTPHRDLIRKMQPRNSPNRCGYNLIDAISDGEVNLIKLLVGSEGTLALVTEATLATQPLPAHRGVALLLFDGLEKASRAVGLILPYRPSACDLLDRRHLTLARESEVRFDLLVPRETEAVLLVEFDGPEQHEVRDRIDQLVDQVRQRKRVAFGSRQAFDTAELELFQRLADRVQPGLFRMKTAARPVPVVEDIAVPPEDLSRFLVRVQNVLKKHEVTAGLFCHAGQGQVHIHPFLDLTRAEAVQTMRRLADDLYQEVLDVGGTISAEHACGLSRTPFVRRQYGDLYEVFRQVKRIFDPHGVFNPGKIVGDDPNLLTKNLRSVVVPPSDVKETPGQTPDSDSLRDLLEVQLNWDPGQVAGVARMCNGCGDCRSRAPDVRMCPIFRIQPAEEASPRAKANLIRGILTGQLDLATLGSEEFKAVADLCVHCHMCAMECPSLVDIPKLMSEGKAAFVAANGLDHGDWAAAHFDRLAAFGSSIGPLTNWALGNRQMRWLIEKTLGIAQGRKLPRVASRSFVRRAARRRLTRPVRRSGRKVAYLVDTFANHCDPQLAEAAVAVLEHNGTAVFVPPDQKQAGMAAIASGALDLAQRIARHNVSLFAEAVRQGYHVIATEPSVIVCLQREYPNLVDDADVELIAKNCSEMGTYLWRMHMQGELQLDFKPVNATLGYHMPCRLKVLRVGSPGENLLRLIPGLTVHRHEEGCSGMAGTFGIKSRNYRKSLRAGRPLITRLRDPGIQAGTTECCSCRMQMEQGTTKPTIHPIKLLALAYGLMPEIASLLTTPGGELLLT
jgi:FAD/FMN-containing dehydrogenase/Fe-S oxidoreductase